MVIKVVWGTKGILGHSAPTPLCRVWGARVGCLRQSRTQAAVCRVKRCRLDELFSQQYHFQHGSAGLNIMAGSPFSYASFKISQPVVWICTVIVDDSPSLNC